MSEHQGETSVSDRLLAQPSDEESLLPPQTPATVPAGLHSWRRAAAAVERETGLDVYAHQEFPQELGGLSKKFVTKIVTVIGETSYTWEARQHRRNRLQRQEVETQPELLPFAVFDSARIRAALSNPVKRISFWVGPLFFLGSLLFVLGTLAEVDPRYWRGEWSAHDCLTYVDVPFFVGAVAFFLGCYASVVEVTNVDVSDAWDEWDAAGRKGPPPKVTYAMFPTTFDSHLLSFYGIFIQYLGSIIFLVGCATEVVHTANPDLSPAVVTWLLDFPYLVGGFCFAVGAYLLAAEGSHSWWRGLLPPLRWEELRSVNYWLELLNWVGSLLFFLAGAGGWFLEGLSPQQEIALAASTWLAGSLIFVVQGALLYLEIVNPAW